MKRNKLCTGALAACEIQPCMQNMSAKIAGKLSHRQNSYSYI